MPRYPTLTPTRRTRARASSTGVTTGTDGYPGRGGTVAQSGRTDAAGAFLITDWRAV